MCTGKVCVMRRDCMKEGDVGRGEVREMEEVRGLW